MIKWSNATYCANVSLEKKDNLLTTHFQTTSRDLQQMQCSPTSMDTTSTPALRIPALSSEKHILCFFLYIFYIHSLQTTEERCVLFACWRGRTPTSSDPPSHQQQGVWIWAKVRFEEQLIVIRSKIRNVKVLKKGEGGCSLLGTYQATKTN